MWNSPNSKSKKGTRYKIREISALIYPLDQLLDSLGSLSVEEVLEEKILQRMDKAELIFSVYEVLDALLEDTPIPTDGHAGYQEAIVAELLQKTTCRIECELEDSEGGELARKSAWQSIRRFCAQNNSEGTSEIWQLGDLRLHIDSPKIHLSKEINSGLWESLLVGEGGLWGEFLWDDDWRIDSLMDLPQTATKKVTELAGINLEVVHRLPHTPTRPELKMAEHYIRYVIWKDEATGLK